ncbi:hypothetical protein [Cupriavidus pauculus]|uniref:Uncharacterized protein n=1 Tax=Cupriavidus pauculus TaxID=82633 RepID=A0A2N5CBR2_9BURK|nr:hypothetical protein [Cupriavidus pauculus]PLP99624.1 hypothetical protein CYJ10_14530 [Cupriavidus pauculus]
MCTKVAKTLLAVSAVSALTIGIAQTAHAAWSEVFVPSNGSTLHVSKSSCLRGTFDSYSDGARIGPRDAFSDGGNHIGPRDAYTDGARSVGAQGDCAMRAA